MGLVFLIIIGTAAGFLATRVMRVEADVPTTVVLGIAGALIGGFLLRSLVVITGWLAGLVGAVLGAIVLIWLYKTYLAR
ncbi:MAG: GlsB/YeaQ/YmgE family stress response membrane protein [Cypionkella sp.]|uniref:GlsB/YeaQ/YmgE family stress response membrane protein n=1 Tax=Cypionkella sp. TaxID=2811411 RepID=UPI002ABC7404|nr:GlsB/YeaQ/YmgE family stress response membrane protein [Cypionkella sp.]MDZ4312384.1 GlsB/YeaQ/YmgE family stress response membrane protein [Cypionkella sp.]